MRIYYLLTLFFSAAFATPCISQSVYAGFVGNSAVEFLIDIQNSGDVTGFYVYNKYDTPIQLNGNLKNNDLTLYEKDPKQAISASHVFKNFSTHSKKINGTWISSDGKIRLPIALNKSATIEEIDSLEILQPTSTNDHYFKLRLNKTEGDVTVVGVKVFKKRSDAVVQQIDIEGQYIGLDNIEVDDYNFDGLEDFSVFESSYAGPNTSRIYILRKVKDEGYNVSDFSGTSLSFNQTTQTIHEQNQCCAGRSHMNATYKVVDNKMALVKRECFVYSEEKNDYIKVPCEE